MSSLPHLIGYSHLERPSSRQSARDSGLAEPGQERQAHASCSALRNTSSTRPARSASMARGTCSSGSAVFSTVLRVQCSAVPVCRTARTSLSPFATRPSWRWSAGATAQAFLSVLAVIRTNARVLKDFGAARETPRDRRGSLSTLMQVPTVEQSYPSPPCESRQQRRSLGWQAPGQAVHARCNRREAVK